MDNIASKTVKSSKYCRVDREDKFMSMDVSTRSSYLNGIEALMTRCSSKLESLVTSVGWTMDSLTKHVKDDDLDEDSMLQANSVEEKPEASISKSKDFEKMYNDLLADLPNQQKKNQEKSEAELLVDLLELERNMKRRRISYKNKVHTKNKSHTEVLRALVREQMDVLKEIAGPDIKAKGTEYNRSETKELGDDAGLIQLGYPRGNPYNTWQKIGQVVECRNPNDSESPHARKDDTSRWRVGTKSRDREQHQSKRWSYSEESRPESFRRFQSEHDDRFNFGGEHDFDSDRPKHDKRTRSTPDRCSEHKSRPHQSKSSNKTLPK